MGRETDRQETQKDKHREKRQRHEDLGSERDRGKDAERWTDREGERQADRTLPHND